MEYAAAKEFILLEERISRRIASAGAYFIFPRWFTGEACGLCSLLVWGLFSPLHPAYYLYSDFRLVFFSSIFPTIERDLMEAPQYKLSGVLRFSFLQSLLAIEGRTIESSEYKQLFNSLMSATLSSLASYIEEFGPGTDEAEVNARMLSSCSKILPQAQRKALLLLGPTGAHRFMHLSVSWLNVITWRDAPSVAWFTATMCQSSLDFSEEYRSMLRISYDSNIGRFWKITSYSPLLAMETTIPSPIAEVPLHRALSNHLLYCIFQFGHFIDVRPDWIEVCLHIDNVRCDVLPLDPEYRRYLQITDALLNERHFPAKISLTIGPENGSHSISLTRSSQNPITDIGKGNTYEVTFEPPKNVGLKASAATTSTQKINNWGFEQSVVNGSDAKIEWTLYDTTTEKPVINRGPPKFSVLGPKTWSIDRYSRACRAFTAEGGVIFAKEDYGNPIKWRFDRHLEGQTLKWVTEGSVWITYWPNTYNTRYSETKRHDFCQELDLTLLQSSHP